MVETAFQIEWHSTWLRVCKPRTLSITVIEQSKLLSTTYSKVSIMRPVLLNDLVRIFPKSLYQTTRSISEKINRTVLFQGSHGQLLVSIKQPDLNIWKNSLLNNQYHFFLILEA